MHVKIHPIKLGFCGCFLLQGDGVVLVDCGTPKQGKTLIRHLEKLSIKPEEIRLIVLTHGHHDHVGSAAEIREMTGAPTAIHTKDKMLVEEAINKTPPGVTFLGKFLDVLSRPFKSLTNFPPSTVDIELGDEDFSLTEYGVPGKVIATPGHTQGSMSVLLDTGEGLVGDLAASGMPQALRPGLPPLAEDVAVLKESWKLLLDRGMKTVYPAHGNPFSAHILKGILEKSG